MIIGILGCIIFVVILYNAFSDETTSNSDSSKSYTFQEKEKDEKTLRLEREELIISQQQHLFKPNWKEFQDILETHQIYCLYHFTDIQNLPSIINNKGLFSLKKCEEKAIQIRKYGSSEKSRIKDRIKGLDKYIRTSFNKKNPMMYLAIKEKRINHRVLLYIDRILIYRKDTLFSNINAESSSAVVNGSLENFKTIRFNLLKNSYADSAYTGNQRFFMAEILFNEKIPARQILNLEYYKSELLEISKTKVYDKKKNYIN